MSYWITPWCQLDRTGRKNCIRRRRGKFRWLLVHWMNWGCSFCVQKRLFLFL